VDFEGLARINSDVVGWVYIEGTSISYPIVQGSDNKFYLNHLFDGSYNTAGCIFLDAETSPDFTEPNSIIYGHNMKDRAMFAALMSYKDQSFFDAHPVVLLLTPEYNYRIRLFSGYVAAGSESAWKRKFPDDSFSLWLQEIGEKSCFRSPLLPEPDSRIVTLSTCTYEYDRARFVLHGYIERSVPAGETP
jgi:sortase B